jgi:hypothetical protein
MRQRMVLAVVVVVVVEKIIIINFTEFGKILSIEKRVSVHVCVRKKWQRRTAGQNDDQLTHVIPQLTCVERWLPRRRIHHRWKGAVQLLLSEFETIRNEWTFDADSLQLPIGSLFWNVSL